ncbi:MAG: capsular exopolysaccharide synthesis family protein [Cellvibrionaceae bacterium]|jgi:capsular exopolysaccharide synthesis family protein
MSLISITDPGSPQAEAFRTLRTNLSFYSLDTPIRSIVITSPTPDEEVAKTAANLAVTMAQGGKKTVLVEADLRRPTLNLLFDVKQEPGLTDALIAADGKLPLQDTGIENLKVLTGGQKAPNPADLLGSGAIKQMVEQLLVDNDILIFNAPPVNAVSDAAVLGSRLDGVLLVINSGITSRDQATQAKETLAKAHVRIIGATLINAATEAGFGDY